MALLVKYNESGNATIDYFNNTDSLGKKWGHPSCVCLFIKRVKMVSNSKKMLRLGEELTQ